MPSQFHTSDPNFHSTNIRQMLTEAADHIERNLDIITNVQAEALFETTREVLIGLIRAFQHFEKHEPVWRELRTEP